MWYEHFTDIKFISMLYTNVPTLKNLRIEKIEISREGDKLTVGFDLPFSQISLQKNGLREDIQLHLLNWTSLVFKK